jgi:hypothetical protein
MHDIGSMVWVALVLIGVVSSIVSNARKSAGQQATAQRSAAPMQRAAGPMQRAAGPMQRAAPARPVARQAPLAPPREAAPATRAVVAEPAPAIGALELLVDTIDTEVLVLPSAPQLELEPSRRGTGMVRGMFGTASGRVRAILAAEILGPPKALQEHSIWSPRHSEPSI